MQIVLLTFSNRIGVYRMTRVVGGRAGGAVCVQYVHFSKSGDEGAALDGDSDDTNSSSSSSSGNGKPRGHRLEALASLQDVGSLLDIAAPLKHCRYVSQSVSQFLPVSRTTVCVFLCNNLIRICDCDCDCGHDMIREGLATALSSLYVRTVCLSVCLAVSQCLTLTVTITVSVTNSSLTVTYSLSLPQNTQPTTHNPCGVSTERNCE